MQLHEIAFFVGMTGAALWIVFMIYEVCVALYRVYTTRQLLRLEQKFLKRWYASAEGQLFERKYKEFPHEDH